MEDDIEHAKGKNDTQLQKYLSTHDMTAISDGATIVKMLISIKDPPTIFLFGGSY